MSADEAREYAYARDLDLVEVAATADPPVCRVMDYGKWRYEEERKARAQAGATRCTCRSRRCGSDRRSASTTTSGSATARSSSSRHRSKVKLVVLFRGREREHPERGRALLERMADDVKEFGQAEGAAVFEGRSMTMVLAPKADQP